VAHQQSLSPHLIVKNNLLYGFKRSPRKRRNIDFATLVPVSKLEGLLVGIPYLFISHSLIEMRLMFEQVPVMNGGRVLEQTSSEQFALCRMGQSPVGYINLLRLASPTAARSIPRRSAQGTCSGVPLLVPLTVAIRLGSSWQAARGGWWRRCASGGGRVANSRRFGAVRGNQGAGISTHPLTGRGKTSASSKAQGGAHVAYQVDEPWSDLAFE
jgi:hypothetical protein